MATAVEKEKPVITLSDLSKHNDKSDCWIALHSKIWDITDFIDEHPGGPESAFSLSLDSCDCLLTMDSPPELRGLQCDETVRPGARGGYPRGPSAGQVHRLPRGGQLRCASLATGTCRSSCAGSRGSYSSILNRSHPRAVKSQRGRWHPAAARVHSRRR